VSVVIQAVSAAEIEPFALDSDANRCADGSLIIYPKRARALARNPHATRDDPVLLLATQDDRCIGYLGLLWDRIWFRGHEHRWVWGLQFYVLPEYRTLPCAFMLLTKAFSLADGWGAWNVAAGATKVCRALGAWQPSTLTRFQLAGWSARLHRLFCRLPFGTMVLRSLLAAEGRELRKWAKVRLRGEGVSVSAAERARPEVDRLVVHAEDCAHFVRSKAKLDWLLGHLWIDSPRSRNGSPWSTRPYPWTRIRPRHELELFDLSSPKRDFSGYLLLCHTQNGDRQVSRTFILDWCWPGPEEAALDVAVGAAAARQRAAGTFNLELCLSERLRRHAATIPGLRAGGPGPNFLACCHRASALRDRGIRDLDGTRWNLGGAEGDQVPLVW
jgi:GNAT superfamily N-acetyltransferase